MLRRHSGPSVAAATLAVFAFLAVDVCAQDATGVASAQPVVPSAGTTAAPTTQRVAPPPAEATGAAAPTAPVTDALPPAPSVSAPIAQQVEPPAPATTQPAVPAPTVIQPAAPVSAQAAATPDTPIAQPMPAAPAETPVNPEAIASDQLPLEPITVEKTGPERLIESFLPGLLPERNENLPHDLSPIGMFMAADWVVKGVMISLAFASLVTWTVWIAKTLQLTGAKARASRGIKVIGNARTLDGALGELERRGGTVAAMVRVANHEVRLSDAAIDHAGGDGVKERVGSALGRIEVQAGRNMSKGTGVLATIGSTAPFVGLFGTVWGIMNSFIGISESQTTNLAVVAPGIAEALLATAIGLVAAIPAVIIYNVFARSVTAYRQSLADAAAGIERLVSRDLDFRKIPVEARANPKIKLVTE